MNKTGITQLKVQKIHTLMESQQNKKHTTERVKGKINKEKLKFLEMSENENTSTMKTQIYVIQHSFRNYVAVRKARAVDPPNPFVIHQK